MAQMYKEKALYIPFATIETGNKELDTALDNQLAYLLAGTNKPTSVDISIATSIVDRLEEAALEKENMGFLDTVACVRFIQGKREKQSTEKCMQLLDKMLNDDDLKPEVRKELEAFKPLLIKRIAACDNNESQLPLEEDALIIGESGEVISPLPNSETDSQDHAAEDDE